MTDVLALLAPAIRAIVGAIAIMILFVVVFAVWSQLNHWRALAGRDQRHWYYRRIGRNTGEWYRK